jgi:hypothetical protein
MVFVVVDVPGPAVVDNVAVMVFVVDYDDVVVEVEVAVVFDFVAVGVARIVPMVGSMSHPKMYYRL